MGPLLRSQRHLGYNPYHPSFLFCGLQPSIMKCPSSQQKDLGNLWGQVFQNMSIQLLRNRTKTCKGIQYQHPTFNRRILCLPKISCSPFSFFLLQQKRLYLDLFSTMRPMYEGRRAFRWWLPLGFSRGCLWLLLAYPHVVKDWSKVAL